MIIIKYMFMDNKYHLLYSLLFMMEDYKINILFPNYKKYRLYMMSFSEYHKINNVYMNYIKLFNHIYYHL